MTKEQLKSKVEELEKELAQFKKELDEKDKSPYCERRPGNKYFAVYGNGEVGEITEYNNGICGEYYDNANYFSDESFAKKVAAEQTLTNLLRKYTYEHGWSDDLWDDTDTPKYCINYNVVDKQLTSDCWFSTKVLGIIHFVDEETVKNAIEEIVIPFVKEHPELGYELKE